MQGHSAQSPSTVQPKLAGPLYNQIQLLMRERILAQEWREGKNLPTEVDLAREYSVSVGTMRKALDVLEDAKFIVRKQGLGTFVRDLNGVTGTRPSGWTVDGKVSAERVVRVISVAAGEAAAHDCSALEVLPRTTIHRIKLVSAIENRGVVLDEYFIPDAVGFSCRSNDVESVQQALRTLERLATRYIESFAVETANAAKAQILRIDAGAQLLLIERKAVDAKSRVMFMCIRTAHLSGARYKVEVDSQ